MKISQAKELYSSRLDALWSRKRELTKILEQDGQGGPDSPNFDRVELSQALSQVDEQYNQTQAVMAYIQQRETNLHNAEAAKQQGEAMADAMDDMMKCMEIARRISAGGKVPAADEKMLMEYSQELYMAAKNLAMMNAQKEHKEYDSLLEDGEDGQEDTRTASEVAGDAEIAVDAPQSAVEAAPADVQGPF